MKQSLLTRMLSLTVIIALGVGASSCSKIQTPENKSQKTEEYLLSLNSVAENVYINRSLYAECEDGSDVAAIILETYQQQYELIRENCQDLEFSQPVDSKQLQLLSEIEYLEFKKQLFTNEFLISEMSEGNQSSEETTPAKPFSESGSSGNESGKSGSESGVKTPEAPKPPNTEVPKSNTETPKPNTEVPKSNTEVPKPNTEVPKSKVGAG